MTDKEKFLVMYPNAVCENRPCDSSINGVWYVFEDSTYQKRLSFSYQNADVAWHYALAVANKTMIEALQR